MIILLICTLCFFLFVSVLKDKKSLLTYYLIYWLFVSALYSLKLFGIYSISDNTFIILILGQTAFCLGYTFVDLYMDIKKRRELDFVNKKEDYFVNTGLVKVLIFIAFFTSLPQLMSRMAVFIQSGFDANAVKNALITGELSGSSILQVAVASPLIYIINIISAYCWSFMRKQKMICWSGIYFTITSFITSGAKLTVAFYFLSILMCFLAKGNIDFSRFKKYKKWISFFSICAFVILIWYMSKDSNKVWENLYYYLCGSYPMLDKVVMKDGLFSNLPKTYGGVTFFAPLDVLNGILGLLGVNILNQIVSNGSTVLLTIERPNYAGTSHLYNAFTTYFADFYIDFGIAGVIVISILCGIAVAIVYVNYKKEKSFFNIVLYCYMLQQIIYGVIRFPLASFGPGLGLIYLLLLRKFFIRVPGGTHKYEEVRC